MKVLKLTDGTELQVSDLSTFGDIVNVFATRAEAGAYWANFTEDSLKKAYLGDEEFSAIPMSMNADIDEKDGNITAHYINYVTYPKSKFDVEEDVIPVEPEAATEESKASTEE